MSPRMRYAMIGIAIGIVVWILGPWWLGPLIVLAAIGIPVAGYLMLDPSQRRRLRDQGRKRLGS